MADSQHPRRGLPAFVRMGDGRLAPFDPDQISQALFAATARLGQPNAFLARQLADGVLHFLALEATEPTPSSTWIEEFTVKIVRELRHPELAQALAESHELLAFPAPERGAQRPGAESPEGLVREALAAYSLDAVFAPDLAAAHREGLLTLGGLEHPLQLAASAVDPPRRPEPSWRDGKLCHAILQERTGVGQVVALDGPEWTAGLDPEAFLEELALLHRATGLQIVVNLNAGELPNWAILRGAGPLFAGSQDGEPVADRNFTEGLLRLWQHAERRTGLFVNWHLGERDFAADASWPTFPRNLDGMMFSLDRPRAAHELGFGLTRQHTTALLSVELHLPRLLAMPGVAGDLAVFQRKLASLARLAISAALQKRQFLRAVGGARHSFAVDRARLFVVPRGLEQAAQTFGDGAFVSGSNSLRIACEILAQLRKVLDEEGRERLLDIGVDFASDFQGHAPRAQLRMARELLAAAGAGQVVCRAAPSDLAELRQLLEFAWRQGETRGLQFCPPG